MKRRYLPLLFIFTVYYGRAQDYSKSINNAFLISRMVEKFHVQPKPMNDELSSQLFQQFLKKVDEERIVFQAEDINRLSVYRYILDEEVNQRKTGFLQLVTSIWQKRIKHNDSLIRIICKTPFQFSVPEKFTEAEDTSYSISPAAKQNKLYKHVKLQMLDVVSEIKLDDAKLKLQRSKKFNDSIEVVLRKRVDEAYQKKYAASLQTSKLEIKLGNLFCSTLATCYDPHTNFMPAEEKEAFDEELGQKPLRFGFGLDENENGEVTIGNLQPGSSAFKSGAINAGDKIIAIQEPGKTNIDVSSYDLPQLDSTISETKTDKLFLTVKKPDGTSRQVTLYKERFATEEDEEDKVQSYVLKGSKNIGYISIPDFYVDWENTETGIYGCANDVAKEIIKLKKENIEGLIIDIRYNGGGSVQEAIELSGIFIDGGPVAQFKLREPKVYTLKDVNSGSIFDGPLVVMVNGYSASASEMFSGTLQDYNRAIIAGTPTYGKATGQVVFSLDTTVTREAPDQKKTEAYIKITTSAIYRLNGQTAQQHGIIPDILLPDLLQTVGEKEKDEQFVFTLAPV